MNERDWGTTEVAIAVDLAVLTVRDDQLQILLVERGTDPWKGFRALPGGFLDDPYEDLDAAAERELAEETGLDLARAHLEQMHTYGSPGRDPRRRVVSVCYLAVVPDLPSPTAGGDARHAAWTPIKSALEHHAQLAFDHRRIITDALEQTRRKLEYTTLATRFCQPEFTVAELRNIYEIVWGEHLDQRNFHRKITGAGDVLTPTGRRTTRLGGRPAALYRPGSATILHPPILRTSSKHASR
ncbi:NUDIX hydrolase [Nocardia cyriacigeorgica]|uniref:NUDIX hydrolase n=1 Tax=Nocardia cyriacigeorgica TaxID=135487 RepID=A0A6P1CX85_9NOCA|nr:NUDIX domain-containing protein [Nocardia cyriacigeorgica]MBF6497409.1 NUDIX hydrolase [Nocardia cyriacigeorgica]NEW36104.1 NUDIX hydrolase [Nocardia cyriacigeorgica]